MSRKFVSLSVLAAALALPLASAQALEGPKDVGAKFKAFFGITDEAKTEDDGKILSLSLFDDEDDKDGIDLGFKSPFKK